MSTRLFGLVAQKYWPDSSVLHKVWTEVQENLEGLYDESRMIITNEEMDRADFSEDDILIIIPLSGGCQPQLLDIALHAKSVLLFAAYIKGNISDEASDLMIKANAAPAFMDCWGVLRRKLRDVQLVLSCAEIRRALTIIKAGNKFQSSKLILIGNTEPWVISVSRDLDKYKKLGIEIQHIDQFAIAEKYINMTDEDGSRYYEWFSANITDCVEPSEADVKNSCRMTAVLMDLLEKNNADGIAIACFNLLALGVTACLAVSYINDCTDKVAACEGDLDSACTMLLMKKISSSKLWIANPSIQPDRTISFSHCTAPIYVCGKACPSILRSHHESGIGASLDVEMPANSVCTLCRISIEDRAVTIQKGNTFHGRKEPACRTQINVRLDNPEHYFETVLGCHQTIAFEDISDDLMKIAKRVGLAVL